MNGNAIQPPVAEGATNNNVVLPALDGSIEASESEDQRDYKPGGYLWIRVGDVFDDGRYTVLEKLGWGHFSTVWLCFDAQERRPVAVKVQKCAPHYEEAAHDEIVLLDDLKEDGRIAQRPLVHLLHHFVHEAPHGNHVCLVFEVLGKSLLSLIRRCNSHGCPLPLVKIITKQMLEALDFVHTERKIIHTDVKPENVLFLLTEEENTRLQTFARDYTERLHQRTLGNGGSAGEDGDVADRMGAVHIDETEDRQFNYRQYLGDPDLMYTAGHVKVVDFGNSCWVNRQFTQNIQTRQYRSPEVIIGAGYDTSADIWSAACLIFELITGDFLFDPCRGPGYGRNEDHLALMMELLGPMPRAFALSGARSHEYFTPQAELQHIRRLNYWVLRDVLCEKYMISPEESDCLATFLLPMLVFEPSKRATARKCLQHRWLQLDEPRTGLQLHSRRVQVEDTGQEEDEGN